MSLPQGSGLVRPRSSKPYLKGFHLLLESWRGGRDVEGWKCGHGGADHTEKGEKETEGEANDTTTTPTLEEVKIDYIVQSVILETFSRFGVAPETRRDEIRVQPTHCPRGRHTYD